MNAARRDDNERVIIEALVACGALVQQIFQGKGVPDLLVFACGRLFLLEVKDPRKSKAAQQLTKDQKEWHAKWAAAGATIKVVRTPAEAIGFVFQQRAA